MQDIVQKHCKLQNAKCKMQNEDSTLPPKICNLKLSFCNFHFLALALTLALLGTGCQSGHQPTDKETANKSWNTARATILFGVAQDQYKAHDFDKCMETLATAVRMTPDSPQIHTLAGKVDIEQGKLELAERELESARQYGPRDPEPFYLSGVIYQRWQKPLTALEFYRQAGERAPAELAYILAQSEMLVTLNRVPEALQLLQAKVGYFENSGAIRDAVGQLLLQSGRYAEAADMLRQASILSEEDDGIRERLAMAQYYNKQYQQSAALLAGLTLKPAYAKRADVFEVLGECQINLNSAHAARQSFETATELNPNSPRAWQGLGRAALQEGDLRKGDFALRRSLAVDSSLGETHLLLGYVRLKQGKLPEALQSFKMASELDDHDTVSLCMVGYTFEKMGQHEAAMKCYARVMKIKPGDDMATQLLAGVER
jgi:tetratricopeptide (TPR) repeat protein